jgi:tetratricopeptide (TPR) repeat protein
VYGTRQDSALLSILLWRAGPFGFPFGLLAPVAAAGLVVGFRREPRRLLLYLFLLAQSMAVVLFFVASRYRLPLVPILILFAVDYCLWLPHRVAHGQWREAGPSLAVLVVAFLAVNRGLPAIDHIYRAETDRYLGIYHVDRGDAAQAEQAYRRALATDPKYAEAHAELGQLLRDQGRYAEALRHLRRANELCPSSEATSYLVGTAYAASGDADSAESWFRRAMAMAPYAAAYRDLGMLLLGQGRLSDAQPVLSRASELDADDLDTWYKLGQCYFLQGRYADAERALREALRLAPGDLEIREKVGSLSRIRRAQ